MVRALAAAALSFLAMTAFAKIPSAHAGAPREGSRFVNLAGSGDRGSFADMFPFLLRKVGTTLTGREGRGAPIVPFDRSAIEQNPSVTWIGHSTFLVRMDGATFLTDPIFSERASPVSFAGPQRLIPPGIPLEALPTLPPIDFVLISHDHYDHADFDSIEALAERGVPFVVPLGLGALVRDAGGRAIELDWWTSTEVAGVRLHCVPAQHFSGRSIVGQDRTLWAGWVVEGSTRRFYHAGDTGYFDGFREIGERLGPMDLAALPIGAYEPEAVMRFVHMNPEEALAAAQDVGARNVIPMHFGTFDLTDEPLEEPAERFRREADRRGIDASRARVLAVGETMRW
jgi:N-acyl-phosphatidylethanolamine-hydrolysing phospholipase D